MLKKSTVAAAVLAAAMMAGGASAATLVPPQITGNDPFPNELTVDGFTTPALAKCDVGTDGTVPKACVDSEADIDDDGNQIAWEDGNAPGDYSGAFTLNYFDANLGTSDPVSVAFNWTFDPDLVTGIDPIDVLFPHYVVVKQANFYDVWELDENERLGGTINTGLGDVSHVSFYNTGDTPVIPLPAAGWLLLAGIGGLAAFRRRKSV